MKKPTSPKPTPFQLASIAAQLLHCLNGGAASAAAEAARVWEACASEIEAWPQRLAQRKADVAELEAQERELKALKKMKAVNLPKPNSHFGILIQTLDFFDPAGMTQSGPESFEKALLWIMPSVDKGKRVIRFRKALMTADGVDNVTAGGYLAQLKKRKWFMEQRKTLERFFAKWWKRYLSNERSKAGYKGGKKK